MGSLEKINNKDIVIKTNDGADIFIFFGEKSEISFKKYENCLQYLEHRIKIFIFIKMQITK